MRWQTPDTSPDRHHWRNAHWDDWEMVWNAVGAERCPRCCALVQTQVRYIHEEWHEQQADFNEVVLEALKVIAGAAGVTVRLDLDDEDAVPDASGSIIIGDDGTGGRL